MNYRWVSLVVVLFHFNATPSLLASQKKNRPNIIVVLADDLGYGDLSCYGHEVIRTPYLNQFAKEGLLLTDCYSAGANCSPSRAGLLTGRTPTRVGIHNWIPFLSPMHLRPSEITIATLLRNAGYTTAHIGKWHLNGWFNLPGQPQPSDHGFDYWYSAQNNALPNHRNPYNFVRNHIPVGPQKGFSAQLVTDEAIGWLTKKRDKAKPFFMYVCYHEPHEPIASDKKYTKYYPFKDQSKVAHHANVTQLDAAFGRLMKALDNLDLRDNTLVIFTSDNGPAITSIHPHGSAGLLRAKKGYLYEGGIRVPGIIRWPGHTKPGSRSGEPVSGVDLLPTLCAITKTPLPKGRVMDGADVSAIVNGGKVDRKRPLYWHFNAAQGAPKAAMRIGDYVILAHADKMIQQRAAILDADQQAIKTAKLTKFELYNLRNDIGQKNDLAAKEPERLKQMAAKLKVIYDEVCAETPTWPAWEFPRYEGQRIEWPAYWKKRKK